VQGSCAQCGHKITIDDAKVPERAFQVKCPKCQALVKFPGKGASEAPEPEPISDEVRAQLMAQVRRELAVGGDATLGTGKRALVALTDKGHAGAITLTLSRLGYQVDTIDDWSESGRLMEQGVYDVIVTARVAGAEGRESLYQRLNRLNPEARRNLFVVLVGNEFKTADGTQAWTCLADLVVNAKDAAAADMVFRNTLAERARLYQVFFDAKKRHEMSAA
jgi:hypothetical protein